MKYRFFIYYYLRAVRFIEHWETAVLNLDDPSQIQQLHDQAKNAIDALTLDPSTHMSTNVNALRFALLWRFFAMMKITRYSSDSKKVNHFKLFENGMEHFVNAKKDKKYQSVY